MKRKFSIFDYTITISRRHRYLVVGSPEFGLQVATSCLHLDQLTPESIGQAVLTVLSNINSKLFELDRSGSSPPKPLRAQLLSRQLLPSSAAARALGVSPATLRKMAEEKRIEHERTAGGHLRFSLEALANHLDREGAA
jgi:excisionase family DNA binding protein